jgi:hypothetical protein
MQHAKNTRNLLTGLVAITPLLLNGLTAQAHNGVKHPKKSTAKATQKRHIHGKSDKPHTVKSGGKMSGMKMGGKK